MPRTQASRKEMDAWGQIPKEKREVLQKLADRTEPLYFKDRTHPKYCAPPSQQAEEEKEDEEKWQISRRLLDRLQTLRGENLQHIEGLPGLFYEILTPDQAWDLAVSFYERADEDPNLLRFVEGIRLALRIYYPYGIHPTFTHFWSACMYVAMIFMNAGFQKAPTFITIFTWFIVTLEFPFWLVNDWKTYEEVFTDEMRKQSLLEMSKEKRLNALHLLRQKRMALARQYFRCFYCLREVVDCMTWHAVWHDPDAFQVCSTARPIEFENETGSNVELVDREAWDAADINLGAKTKAWNVLVDASDFRRPHVGMRTTIMSRLARLELTEEDQLLLVDKIIQNEIPDKDNLRQVMEADHQEKQKLDAGEITEEQYKAWKKETLATIGIVPPPKPELVTELMERETKAGFDVSTDESFDEEGQEERKESREEMPTKEEREGKCEAKDSKDTENRKEDNESQSQSQPYEDSWPA